MSVKTHCRCEYPEWSSLIRVNSFIKDLNLFFFQRSGLLSTLPNLAVGFCPVGYCPVGFCPSGRLSQWAFVRSPCVCVCVCVCVQGSSTGKTMVCASSENSRESVRSLESAIICADFYNSSKLKYILRLLHI